MNLLFVNSGYKERLMKEVEQPRFKLFSTKRQWSFFWAGITFGIAQIVYMLGLWLPKALKGESAHLKPITVTTDLGKMFRGLELGITKFLHIPDPQLYGHSIDGVASGGAFVPGIGWPIFGMMLGGLIVTLMEREHKSWVKYPAKLLVVSFFGGAMFSYGTRLAGGCTLNHLLGGIPLLSIHSSVTVIFMAIGGMLGFLIMGKLGLAQYFKHQESKSYCTGDEGECPAYDPDYKWYKNPWYWAGAIFSLLFFGIALYGGLANPEALQHLKGGTVKAFNKSISHKGSIYVFMTLIAGIIGGIGMAKSGFGTECALVSLETANSMTKNDKKYANMRIPMITRILMRGYLPIIGLAASWVLTGGFIAIMWLFFDVGPAFEGSLKYQLTAGNIIGGLFLGIGAVTLIGCEIRSYMRIGLGYLNTLVGFMGFAVGYLPYTLFKPAHEAFKQNTLMIEQYKWYQLIAPNSLLAQKLIFFVWILILAAFLYSLIKMGAKNTGVRPVDIINLNTEDLTEKIIKDGIDGKLVGDIKAPMPVPKAGSFSRTD